MLDADLEKIHQDFVTYGKNAREWIRKCQLLLPLIAEHRVWEKKRFSSIYEYAAKLAGMGRSSVDTALWTLRKVADLPALQAVAESKGVNRVRAVAKIATPETQDFWADKAKTMSVRTLEMYVRETRNSLHVAKAQPDGLDVTVHLNADLARRLEQLKKHADFEKIFERVVARMEDEVVEAAPESVRGGGRHIPVEIDRFVTTRTGGLCAWPTCTREATSLHHAQRWGLEKVHDPARLHAVCTAHERLAHLGLIENEEEHPSRWRLREHADAMANKRFIDQFVALYRPT